MSRAAPGKTMLLKSSEKALECLLGGLVAYNLPSDRCVQKLSCHSIPVMLKIGHEELAIDTESIHDSVQVCNLW